MGMAVVVVSDSTLVESFRSGLLDTAIMLCTNADSAGIALNNYEVRFVPFLVLPPVAEPVPLVRYQLPPETRAKLSQTHKPVRRGFKPVFHRRSQRQGIGCLNFHKI